MKSKSSLWLRTALSFLVVLGASTSLAQTEPSYQSAVDQDLRIDRVLVLPITDNLSGIYAKPLTERLTEKLSQDPRWTLVAPKTPTARLEESPAAVQKFMKEHQVNSVLQGRILKGPAGLTLRLIFSVGAGGLPLLIEETTESKEFSTEKVLLLLEDSLQRLRDRLPYHGIVSSRRGQQVTISLGAKSGLRQGDVVDIIQILKVTRHPKHQFVISTDKEVLGKAQIFKADEELSFANLTFEKEAGVVVPGLKVNAPRPILYSASPLGARAEKDVAFGDQPFEWLPSPTPQYGRLQILAGLAQHAQSVTLDTAGSLTGNNAFAPTLGLLAEGWLNRDWWIGFSLRQSTYSVANALSGSSPAQISMSISKFDVSAGYNFLMGDDFFGPKLQISLGMAKFSARAEESAPLVFSSMDYSGSVLGLTFNTNLGPESDWELGARMKYYLSPSASASGGTGPVGSVSANDFSFLLGKRMRQNFRYIAELNFESYSADFNTGGTRPDPASSTTHRATTALVGLEYSF